MTTDAGNAEHSLPLVGRARELASLTERLLAPRTGEVDVLLITGEPGVGKTRFIQEARRSAQALGWAVLLGHAYDTEGMPPYLPFIEALQEYAAERRPGDIGSGETQIPPELVLLLPGLGPVPTQQSSALADPESQRYLLFEAVCDLLGRIARSGDRGLLLCLEDLHWADDSTLLLLEHLTRKKTLATILILGSYRDTDLDVSRPLARTLEQLLRQQVASRIDLRGLDRGDLAALLAVLGGPDPPTGLVDTIFSETEGNPFFAREVFEYLSSEGRLFDRDGRWRRNLELSDTDVPQGLRLVIGRRLERLSRDCRQVLPVAAVLGRRFSFELLRKLAQVSEQALLEAVEEAERAHVLSSDANGSLIFAHELVRQTLLAGLSPLRRQRQHLLAADALEAVYARDLRPHLAEIAGQYRLAGAAADPEKVLDYCLQAARAAEEISAWQEAAKLYEVVLETTEANNRGDDTERCDLLLALMAALLPAGESRRVLDQAAPQAYALAESLRDRRRMSAVALAALDAATRLWGPSGVAVAQGSMWLQRADECTDAETKERVIVDVQRGSWLQEEHGFAAQRASLSLQAYEMAKRVGDREALFEAACSGVFATPPPAAFIPQMMTVLREITAEPREGISFRLQGLFLLRAGFANLACGDRASFEEMLVDLEDLAGKANEAIMQDYVVQGEVVKATLDGKLQGALELYRAKTPSSPQTRLMTLIAIGRINLWLGRFREVVADFDALPDFWSSPSRPERFEAAAIAYLAAAGVASEARARLSTWASRHPLEEMNLNWQLWTLEAAVLLRDVDLARRLSREIRNVARLVAGTYAAPTPPGRLLGDAATLLAQPDEARSYYEIALGAAEKIACRPDVALARLSLGELLLKHYPAERLSAHEHLDFAIAEFETMGMRPSLERALRLRGRRRPADEARTATYPDHLSQREVEVLRLVALGKSNREISEDLFLSVRTVERHITNVYAKIGARTKAQATSYAHRNALL